jgi:3,4-dihydroxy-2-butanone 4-phosphate synthase
MDSFKKVQLAINEFKANRPIIMVDSEDRENEGDLVFPGELITPSIMNFIIRNTSGIVCLSLAPNYIEKLNLPPMVVNNNSRLSTAFTVSIEAKEGITTGVSASDRVKTIRVAINEAAKPEDLARPGHVFPLAAKPNGVLERPGHTEGSVDLMKIGGYKPAAVLSEIMNADGTMAKGEQLQAFAKLHQLMILTIDDIIKYRLEISK